MLKLNPIKSEKIWGYELWIASTHPNGCQDDFKNACGGDYPLLVKVIQADDTLSVQIHPDDKFAVELEGEGNRGKTECWYVLDAKPNAKLVYGLKDGVSKEELKKAIEENALEPYLNFVSVRPGDFIFIPAGTVHAIGSGLRLMEVQQSCDLTYRFYDWGRGREVHVEKALAVIKANKDFPVAPFPKSFECEYFTIDEITVKGGWSMFCSHGNADGNGGQDEPKDWQLLYVLESNKAVIRNGGDKVSRTICAEEIYAIAPGEKITVEGQAKLLKICAK